MANDERPIEPQPPEAGPEPESELSEETGSKALADALKTSFFFLKVVILVMVVAYLATGVFSVPPSEVAFVLNFGKLVPEGQVMRPGTGLHFRWPWQKVETESTEEKTLELDKEFWPGQTDVKQRGMAGLDVRRDGYLITGDVNVVHMKLRARYRVRDDNEGAIAYKFGIEKPEGVLRRLLEAATCKVVGTMHVMDVIEREGLFSRIEQELRDRIEGFEDRAGIPLGLELVAVEAVEVPEGKNPTEPRAVSRWFFQAQDAVSRRNQLVQEGQTAYSRMLQEAEAERAEILGKAQGERTELVRGARADAQTLQRILPIYNESPAVRAILLDRFYKRAIEEVVSNSPGSFVLHRTKGDSARELRLMFNRVPPVPDQQRQGSQGG
ncbi:MAG: SPFH domain-containing protein [Candidatus Brocadiia bacterium]